MKNTVVPSVRISRSFTRHETKVDDDMGEVQIFWDAVKCDTTSCFPLPLQARWPATQSLPLRFVGLLFVYWFSAEKYTRIGLLRMIIWPCRYQHMLKIARGILVRKAWKSNSIKLFCTLVRSKWRRIPSSPMQRWSREAHRAQMHLHL